MLLARARTLDGSVTPLAGLDGRWFDVSMVVPTIDSLAVAPAAITRVTEAVRTGDAPEVATPRRWAAPLEHVGKVVCVGLNYRDHATETGAELPAEPILFLKAGDTVVGPDDDVLVPRNSTKTDYEVELAVVIGTTAVYLDSPQQATDHIAGFAISNDISEREFQIERGGQWDKGKNCATFNPLGPWLATPDEVGDVQALGMRLWVDGELRQDGSTKDMVFAVDHLVWYISQFMTLYPGDVINTGTPAGVAMGRPCTPYLLPGSVMEVEIDRLGHQRQSLGQA